MNELFWRQSKKKIFYLKAQVYFDCDTSTVDTLDRFDLFILIFLCFVLIQLKTLFAFFFPCVFFFTRGGRKWFTPIRERIHSLLECSKSQIVICQLWIIIQGWSILFMMHESSVQLKQQKCCHTSWQFKATGNKLH